MNYTDHRAYQLAHELSNIIWSVVKHWSSFEQNTIDNQLVRSCDSVSSNVAEGWGRYYKKDKILFYTYARASLHETMDWLLKAHNRRLIDNNSLERINEIIQTLPKELNGLIKGTRINLKF